MHALLAPASPLPIEATVVPRDPPAGEGIIPIAKRATLISALKIAEDRELVRELLRLHSALGTGPAAKDAAALAVKLLLWAGRHAALLALTDGELVVNGLAGNGDGAFNVEEGSMRGRLTGLIVRGASAGRNC